MIQGFKDFISRGNVVDLAVGIVIGGAFATVITAVVDGLITPIVAMIFGQPDLTQVMAFTINNAHFSIGLILDALFKFITIALAIYFVVVVPMNKLAERRTKADDVVEESGPTEVELLMEIRDSLKK
ncbi:large conductance mechanosensitive channel protein MscL [uncultured Demequina sp.]|uniref:large conductance mechanosensitive channel protein MscL n=1 Tax=uncultured Demequina sp. TaxID=693499 RepID=UPI0025DCD2AB|nr:large conductance mechanosensitive channel protein MscL [uncultured Demequina sp.]